MAAPVNLAMPYYEPGGKLTGHATGVIRGKRFIKLSASRQSGPAVTDSTGGGNYQVAECSVAGEKAVGVAGFDAAIGAKVEVHCTPGMVIPVTAGAAIVVGAEVSTDSQGRAITYVPPITTTAAQLPLTPYLLGLCMTAASGVGVDAEIKLY